MKLISRIKRRIKEELKITDKMKYWSKILVENLIRYAKKAAWDKFFGYLEKKVLKYFIIEPTQKRDKMFSDTNTDQEYFDELEILS